MAIPAIRCALGMMVCLAVVAAPLIAPGQDSAGRQTPMLRPPSSLSQPATPARRSAPPAAAQRTSSPRTTSPSARPATYAQPAAIGTGVARTHALATYQAPGMEGYEVPATQSLEPLPQGEVIDELSPPEAYYEPSFAGRRPLLRARPGRYGQPAGDMYGPVGPMAADCGPGCFPTCGPPPLVGWPMLGSLEAFAGVHGFTGVANRGSTGSFGFQEGVQAGVPIFGLTGEIGAMVTQSNFNGNAITDETRHQFFLSAGLSRRADWGLQGGLVYDWLHEDWDYEIDLGQLRGELSYLITCRDDVGSWFTIGVKEDTSPLTTLQMSPNGLFPTRGTVNWQVDDLFAFFWRRQFDCGGEGRLFGGFTSEGQGLFGGDIRLPMNCAWSFETNFLYVTARGDREAPIPDFAEETWNVSLNVVWTPFGSGGCKNYSRPLLGVANNGNFISRF